MALHRLESTWAELAESGSAHIVGFVAADGVPFTTRGWGMRFVGPATVRLVLGQVEVDRLGLPPGGLVGRLLAVTCADVRTLRSAQVKGPVTALEPLDDADRAAHERYCEGFFDAVLDVDLIARPLMERLVPADLVTCTFDVVEAYDQTPGPGAGARLEAAP